jgi:hypothetical protein
MAETIEELTLDYEEEGRQVRRTLDKAVLTKGAWSTVAFLFQEKDRNSEDWGENKVSVRRYKKVKGVYREQSKFNISNGKQAHALIEVLLRWFPAAE